jgi:hypothetical protein
MTYSEFKNKYMGVKCGNTAANMGECVGLVSLWMDNLNIPHEWGNAKDLLANANTQYVDVINNTADNFPVQGDIMVWGASWGGGYGHTGVVEQADKSTFITFEQNNPGGNPPEAIGHRSYAGVIGWLHPKNMTNNVSVDSTTFENLVRKSTAYDTIINKLQVADSETIVYADVDKLLQYEQAVLDKDKQLNEAQGQIAALQDTSNIKAAELAKVQEQLSALQKTVDSLTTDNQIQQKELEAAKQQLNQPIATGWKLALINFINKF